MTEGIFWIGAMVQAIVIIGGLFAAWRWSKLKINEQTKKELERLVDARGERIKDLETSQKDLIASLGELRGEVKLLRELKTQEIIAGVADELSPFMQDISDRLAAMEEKH